jgi:Ni/Co efflux regulator RcnB
MKKLLTALSFVLAVGFASAQQTIPAAKQTMSAKTPAKSAKSAKSAKMAAVAKPASTSGVKMKKDGTPDKRYKNAQHLKKDGTIDKRYKK